MKKIAIIGAGTMGHSLAQVFSQGGYSVALNDISKEILERAKRLIASNLDTLSEAGMFDPAERKAVLEERIHYTTELKFAVSGADLVIEAIVEDPEAKRALFSELERLCPQDVILASNTSYLDIFSLVDIKHPHRLIITHWFAPPHIIPLVEIVKGPETSADIVERVKAVLEGLGKQTIVLNRYLPGFIVNRLQSALGMEVLHLLEGGYATGEDIDRAAKASFILRMPILGVVKRMDYTGLDLVQKIIRNKSYSPPQTTDHSEIIDRLVSQRRFGVKNGIGFYDYGGKKTEELLRERDLKLLKLRKFLQQMGELD